MSHVDLARAATHAYVGSIEELGRRLEPSVGVDYCEACDVPTLAPPQSFFAKVAEAGELLRQDEYVDATAKASEAVEIIRELLSAEAETGERVAAALDGLSRAGITGTEFALGQPSLDEVFLALTGSRAITAPEEDAA